MTIFRVDFGPNVGMGHLMRSLTYAKRFDKVVYISKSDKKELVPYELITIKNEEEFFNTVKRLRPKRVVVDNYNFTFEYEKEFKNRFPHIELSVFDDDYREHFCDEIINHNISANKNRYPNPDIVTVIPPLIREEFHKEKEIKREKVYDVFIAMGGTDAVNLNISLLETLPQSLKIALVTTSANAHLKALREYVKEKKNITLHIDSKEIAKLMNQSRFAIVTPSVVVHEVLFMELPFLAIQTAKNQQELVRYLKKHDYTVLESFDKAALLQKISPLIAKHLQYTAFVDLSDQEKRMVLTWRNTSTVRKWMQTRKVISLNEHLHFIDSLKKSTDKHYFVIKEKEEYLGVIDLTDVDPNEKKASIGLYANPFYKNKGAGTKLMASILDYTQHSLDLTHLTLKVQKENKRAIGLYKKFGFREYGKIQEYLLMELIL